MTTQEESSYISLLKSFFKEYGVDAKFNFQNRDLLSFEHLTNESTSESKTKVITTTFVNACRILMNDTKYMLDEHSWAPLAFHEKVTMEKYLRLCLLESNILTLQKQVTDLSRHESEENVFSLEKKHITAADLVLFYYLHQLSANERLPNVNEWIHFLERKLISSVKNKTKLSLFFGNMTFPANFIRQTLELDLKQGKHKFIRTRFPPEPNGFLHLGHAKSICLNFGLARDFQGICHLRFDDTNPVKENIRYIEAIKEDVKWLGFNYENHLYYTSDYFDQLYQWAVELIKKNLAYVDNQTEQEVRKNRGDLFTPGVNSPYRDRTVETNLMLFEKMKNGEIPEGSCVLRAKIDMSHGNMIMRDPPIYRIRFHAHPRTQKKWCIYPIYDFAHGQSDSIERITHSLCTLEFEDHRPLYNWFQEKLDIFRTRQIEFARLNCTYTVMSKRKLSKLVEQKFVKDWDDPRLPTLSGLRRRGYPPQAIRSFCEKIGVAKRDTTIPLEFLEFCVTTELHPIALRRNVVLYPLKVKITNLPDTYVEKLVYPNHPENVFLGTREVHFCNELYIDRNDFMIHPPDKYFRLCPNGEVRLRYAYWIKCHDHFCDEAGNVIEVHCTYDPNTRNGMNPSDGRKVKGTLHWISSYDAIEIEARLYDRLFKTVTPDSISDDEGFEQFINEESLETVMAKGERCLATARHPYLSHSDPNNNYFQFERVGFFVPDYDSTPEHPIMNLVLRLTDTWAMQNKQNNKDAQRKITEKAAREKAAEERRKKKEARLSKCLFMLTDPAYSIMRDT